MSGRTVFDMVQLSVAVPRGEAGFWTIIRDLDLGGPWTARDVTVRTNVSASSVARFVRKLRLGGYVTEVGEYTAGRSGANLPAGKTYRLLKCPLDPPRLGTDGSERSETATDKLWRAMKMSKTFNVEELSELCPDVPASTARGYLSALTAAGVISRSGGTCRIILNVGSRAPRILVTKHVFDPNANEVIGRSVAREVQP